MIGVSSQFEEQEEVHRILRELTELVADESLYLHATPRCRWQVST